MRFHVYAVKQRKSPTTPYILDLQNNLLDGLNSRVVAPLRLLSAVSKSELIQDLMPVFTFGGEKYVLVTLEMASFPVSLIGKMMADLSPQGSVILNAVDRLLSN